MEKKETDELSGDNCSNSNEVSNNSSMDSLSMGLKRLNVDAPVFVPSFAINTDINTLNNKEDNKQLTLNLINNKTTIDDKNTEDVVDDWEANADEEDDDEEDEGFNHFYFVIESII